MTHHLIKIIVTVAFSLLVALLLPATAATNTFSVVNSGASAYVINGVSNPDLFLVKGFTYTFNINASGHPFWIKTIQGAGTDNAFNDGVTGNGTSLGTVQFSVPTNAPSQLFYNCQFHSPMTGTLNITNPPVVRVTGIAVDNQINLISTGTDSLNLYVDSRTNLVAGIWDAVDIASNIYLQGTNTTFINPPTKPAEFFRVRQALP